MFNRVRVVLESETDPVKLMNTFKTYASRRLSRTQAMGATWEHDGYGRIRVFGMQFGMWWMIRVRRWWCF
jgi:hypothetical protein